MYSYTYYYIVYLARAHLHTSRILSRVLEVPGGGLPGEHGTAALPPLFLGSLDGRRRIELDMAAARPAYIDRRIELFEKFSKE